MNIRCLAICFFLYASTPVLADNTDTAASKHQCSESTLATLGKHFDVNGLSYPNYGMPPNAENGGVIVAGVCKEWPNDKSRTIAVVAYDAGVESEKRLLVALVDTSKAMVVASYQGAIEEDASMTVGSNSLRIDTARYDLALGVRAFGLDVVTGYSQGCVDGGLGPVRTLFVQDGKAIRPVLEGFYISSWRFVKGGPSCVSDDREAVTEDISYVIGISNVKTNGYANLKITATSSEPTRKPLWYELQYTGKHYPTTTFNGAGEKIDRWRN